MVDLFISYARSDREAVRRVADAVKALGYSVWWDEDPTPRLSFGQGIVDEIGQAKAALVVWSRASRASELVRAEAGRARSQKKLIQTAIDDGAPPLPFNQIQFAKLREWNGEADHPAWRKVRSSLAALCGPAPAEAGTAPATPSMAKLPPAALYEPPRRPKSRSRVNRVAVATIAASLAVILTVGGLVMLKSPPPAEARQSPPPAAPVPAPRPAKFDITVQVPPTKPGADADSPPAPQDDFPAN